jgi:hypothetical protein
MSRPEADGETRRRGARCYGCKDWQEIEVTRPIFIMHGHPDSNEYTDGPRCQKCGHTLWRLYNWHPDDPA